MPKENVNCVAMPQLRAEVAWKPDADGSGYVQLATVHTDSPATTLGEHVVTPVRDLVTGEPTGTVCSCGTASNAPDAVTCPEETEKGREKLDGWHVTLNREGINRLIRVLRRARDSAFGSDA